MYYFAYGSNMLTARMKDRTPSVDDGVTAYVVGHELRFHKRGLRDGTAKCNAVFTGNPEDILYGVLYVITDAGKEDLDRIEGLGIGYLFKEIEVCVPGESNVIAYMYSADPEYIDENLKPYAWYVKLVLDGALEHKLPHEYILKYISRHFPVKRPGARDAQSAQRRGNWQFVEWNAVAPESESPQ